MDIPCSGFAVREWMPGPCAWECEAFSGLPVRREFRLFVENGQVSHVQPYWPEEAFEEYEEGGEWRGKLMELSEISGDDLQSLSEMSLKVAADLGGDWSVDWLWSDRGWILTDMAVAELSYRYEPKDEWRRKFESTRRIGNGTEKIFQAFLQG